MNIKQFETNLESVKNLTPEVFKKTMETSIPFFMLHQKIYEKGENLISNEFNINQNELDVLCSLYYMGGKTFSLTPTELYDVMLFSSGGMTKLLKKLESKQLIQRVESERDKRSKLVQISSLGIKVTTQALKDIVSFEDEYFSKLSDEEQKSFQELIYKMMH